MLKRLSGPLTAYPDRDEFQIGRMLVWVRYPIGQDRSACLTRAEELLPSLELDISKAAELATREKGSTVPATVAGIMIEADGSASYDCTFFDGEHEGDFLTVHRDSAGGLTSGL